MSVVLPTYNERDNVGPLIRELDERIEQPGELIVVDDDSPDGTAREVERIAAARSHVRLIMRRERGLTGAIQRGIDESRGAVVVWMDCDLSMPPETVPLLIRHVLDGYDAAVGSRYVPGGGGAGADADRTLVRLQRALTLRLNRAITAVLGADFHDWTSGFIAVRGPLIRCMPLAGDYGEYFIDLMARLVARRCRLVEVPYVTAPRRHGESKTAATLPAFARLGVKYLRAFAAARRTLAVRTAR